MLYDTALCSGPIQNGIMVAVGRVRIVGGWGVEPPSSYLQTLIFE